MQAMETNPRIAEFKAILHKIIDDFRGKIGQETELSATLANLHKQHPTWKYDDLVAGLKQEKSTKFSDQEIEDAVVELEEKGYIDKGVS